MKKTILFLAALLAASIFSYGQEVQKAEVLSSETSSMNVSVDKIDQLPSYGAYELRSAYETENDLLSKRKAALWTTIGGITAVELGALFVNDTGNITDEGAVFVVAGGIAALAGGIWLVVNEFKLINTRTKINEKMILTVSPNGIKINF